MAIQIKDGVATRTRRGHRVRAGDHGDNWRDGIPPVLCVVHDPDRGGLFRAHATRRLRRAQALRNTPKSIVVQAESRLDDDSLPAFVEGIRTCLPWERQGVARWADMADVEFAKSDIVKSFVNDCGEPVLRPLTGAETGPEGGRDHRRGALADGLLQDHGAVPPRSGEADLPDRVGGAVPSTVRSPARVVSRPRKRSLFFEAETRGGSTTIGSRR
ncbi:hypothetical protein ACIQF6_11190 [Kitasatospora sp. NPDC092948]|uniref:hypothetical protein n=1 Tax=Kitasatospora sp. NPDC092948 TaxID=3364088 RepID=UPI0037F13C92